MHEDTGAPCACGRGLRLVRCYDCFQLPLLCKDCWITVHKNNPLHWAHVWGEGGYSVKHDISALGYTIPIGHEGDLCPTPGVPQSLIIAHVNSVHATQVSYCGCEKSSLRDKWTQLFIHDLCPSTVGNPQSCFTFPTMRQYTMLHYQCQITPYNYMKSIRRQTNNVFTGDVPVSFDL